MMYSPDMVMGGRLRLADGGMLDMSTGDTLDWKQKAVFMIKEHVPEFDMVPVLPWE